MTSHTVHMCTNKNVLLLLRHEHIYAYHNDAFQPISRINQTIR
jgi:hypothetical protein